jgi:hypothetical protein
MRKAIVFALSLVCSTIGDAAMDEGVPPRQFMQQRGVEGRRLKFQFEVGSLVTRKRLTDARSSMTVVTLPFFFECNFKHLKPQMYVAGHQGHYRATRDQRRDHRPRGQQEERSESEK